MNKGLEALEHLKLNKRRHWLEGCMADECFIIIEKELKELEERREMMGRFNEACIPMILDNETKKKLKALDIIKNKNFDLFYLLDSKDLEMYNDACDIHRNLCYLTQKEYDLLKEVLS